MAVERVAVSEEEQRTIKENIFSIINGGSENTNEAAKLALEVEAYDRGARLEVKFRGFDIEACKILRGALHASNKWNLEEKDRQVFDEVLEMFEYLDNKTFVELVKSVNEEERISVLKS